MTKTDAERARDYRDRRRQAEKLPPHLRKLFTDPRPRFNEKERNEIRALVASGELEVPPEGFMSPWGKPGWYPGGDPNWNPKLYAARMTDYGRKPWIGGSRVSYPRPDENVAEVRERRAAIAQAHGVAIGWVRADGTVDPNAKPLSAEQKRLQAEHVKADRPAA